MNDFNVLSFILRWIFAIVLVFGTYNPTDYSYVSWVTGANSSFEPVMALVGVALLIAWLIFLRATMVSLGLIGIILFGALFACLIWVLVDMQWLTLDSSGAMTWVILLVLSFILAVGMSWSHIWRRLSGQVSVDEQDH
jgi:hypothetical protein